MIDRIMKNRLSLDQVLAKLNRLARAEIVETKERKFGITANNALGIYQKDIKTIAKGMGFDDDLAVRLFDTGIYEARLLCSKVYDPLNLTHVLMEAWVKTFENWEICDSFCMGLFSRSKFALPKALEWSKRDAEFEKRAGFVIMAAYGSTNKEAENDVFQQFFPVMVREAKDERKYVSKAINWALRQIGKRNPDLRAEAIKTAKRISRVEHRSAQWIANDALKELVNPNTKILNYPKRLYGKPDSE